MRVLITNSFNPIGRSGFRGKPDEAKGTAAVQLANLAREDDPMAADGRLNPPLGILYPTDACKWDSTFIRATEDRLERASLTIGDR